MSVRSRVAALERGVRLPEDVVVPIFLGGRGDDHWRARAEEARSRGHRLRVIRFGVMDQADTPEEAEALITRHKKRERVVPITIYRRGSRGEEVLAEWDPGLPGWLHAPLDP